MATKYERYNNSAFTYLRTGISVSDLVVQVYEVRRFSTSTNTRVRIGSEIVRVVDVDLVNKTLTLVRGVEGTVAKAHDAGDLIISVLTQGGLDQMLTDRVLYAKNRPQLGQISDQNGDKAEVADFTWIAQSSATATDVHGNIELNGSRGIGFNSSCLMLSTPSTPWTFTVGWRPFMNANVGATTSLAKSGLTVKNTGNARMLQLAFDNLSSTPGFVRTFILRQTDPQTGVAIQKNEMWERRYDDIYWARVTDNGTNLVHDISRDGVNWHEFYSASRTAWITSGPNQVGFFVDPFRSDVSFGSNMDNFATYVHASFT